MNTEYSPQSLSKVFVRVFSLPNIPFFCQLCVLFQSLTVSQSGFEKNHYTENKLDICFLKEFYRIYHYTFNFCFV